MRLDRTTSPTPLQTSNRDGIDEFLDGFSGLSINGTSLPEVYSSDGIKGDYISADAAVSSFPQSATSGYDTYAYDADTFTDLSSNTFQADDRSRSNGDEYSATYRARSPLGGFDPFTTAASNVLGGGPPVHDEPAHSLDSLPSHPVQTVVQNLAVQGSTMSYDGYHASQFPSDSSVVNDDQLTSQEFAFLDDTASTLSSGKDLSDNSSRPSLHRSGTTGSVSLGTRKMKAVDLSSPPYTKEFIDEYRQRIKNDPDPEAHFRYAKYLIDAARHVGSNAADQRAVRKFRELLVQEALKVFRRLATQGEPYAEAQFFLANCHGTGMLGLPVDHERAYHLYLQAAKQNHAAAAYRVAVCNEIGAGTRREPPRAFAFYRKSASLGDTAAMYKLGMVLLSGGLGQPPNPREAVAWLRRAAEQADEDNPHALHELAMLHENSESKIVPYDPLFAKNLYTKAAQLGYTQSQFKLGQCYEYGTLTCAIDPRRSIGWYTKAAEKGNAEAELALSGWYLTGSEGVLKQSDSEAYLWARRAANKGLSTAEYAVGYFSEVGIGVKQDIELAKRWYMRAAGEQCGYLLVPGMTYIIFICNLSSGEQTCHEPSDRAKANGQQAGLGYKANSTTSQGRVCDMLIGLMWSEGQYGAKSPLTMTACSFRPAIPLGLVSIFISCFHFARRTSIIRVIYNLHLRIVYINIQNTKHLQTRML